MEIHLQKWGNSYGIRIPKSTIQKFNLKENQSLILDDSGNNIIISKPVHLSLAERMKGYKGKYVYEKVWDDEPVGKEIW